MSKSIKLNIEEYVNRDYLLSPTSREDTNEILKQLETIGFFNESTTVKPRFQFDPNIFADYLCRCVTAVRDENDNIYLYRNNGVYVEAQDWLLKILCKQLMNQLLPLWSLSYEHSGLESFRRDVKTVVKHFNATDRINLQNGILSIDQMKLKVHTPHFYSTVQLGISYDDQADCPRFIQFIQEITANNSQLAVVLQEIVGYCLCQSTKAEKAFLFYGNGKNGKSVLAKVMENLVGSDNVSHVTLADLNDNFGLETMVNKNLNIAAENDLRGKLGTSRFKAIVSGDCLNVNRKYLRAISQPLYCKLVFLVNTLPNSNDFSFGFYRKLMIVPFTSTFTNPDVNLIDKLMTELSGILNWGLEGLKRLRQNDYQFSHCEAIKLCNDEYQNSQNPTGIFFWETYKQDEKGRLIQSEIYMDYCSWARENSMEPVSLTQFWTMLNKKAEEPNSLIKLNRKKDRKHRYIIGYSRIYEKTVYQFSVKGDGYEQNC